MPEGVTSFAQRPATSSKASVMPSFLEEQGTWMATLSLTWFHSSLSFKCVLMNSMGSYRENLKRYSPRECIDQTHCSESCQTGLQLRHVC